MPVPAVIAAAAKTRAALGTARHGARHWRLLVAAGAAIGVAATVPMTVIVIAVGGTRDPAQAASGSSAAGLGDVPVDALAAYRDAAQRWQMDWAVLAGIGKLECDHGRSQLPGCNPPDTTNGAGARGYMQFIGTTWRRGLGQHQLESRSSPPAPDGEGYATDGDEDGDADPWSWSDAAHSAARYLTANGINDDPEQAIWRYNHNHTYVARVLELAATYRASTVNAYEGSAGVVPLSAVACPGGGSTTVHARLAQSVAAMYQAATTDGIHLCGNGYRDPQHQIELRRAHCGTSDYAIFQMPPSQCSPPTARPGTSRHERGLAIDLTCDGELIRSRHNGCYEWLVTHAAFFGLYNLPSESWHWSVDSR